jgi:hypothetical protein
MPAALLAGRAWHGIDAFGVADQTAKLEAPITAHRHG